MQVLFLTLYLPGLLVFLFSCLANSFSSHNPAQGHVHSGHSQMFLPLAMFSFMSVINSSTKPRGSHVLPFDFYSRFFFSHSIWLYAMLGIEPRALCILSYHPTDQATSPVPALLVLMDPIVVRPFKHCFVDARETW